MNTKLIHLFSLVFLILLLISTSLFARPKIGLALGGGGAKGGAHVGVLKALEREQIPVDYIAGTSIGSIVGGLYAMGYSAAEIEKKMMATTWEEGYSDSIPRQDLPYRLKQRDQFNVPLDIGLRDYQITSPSGLLYGQRAAQLLRETFG
ncbi:patatin-like phospholipase family protein, partial [Oleiphilus sp. HI0061]